MAEFDQIKRDIDELKRKIVASRQDMEEKTRRIREEISWKLGELENLAESLKEKINRAESKIEEELRKK